MAKKFLTSIRLASLSTDPTGSNGDLFYNSTSNTIRARINNAWKYLGIVVPTDSATSSTIFTGNTTPTSPVTGDIWVDSSFSTTSSNILRWRDSSVTGQTTLSGTDDNGTSLSYIPGYEQVYINGVLQFRGSDYTATNGTSITGLTALSAGDVVEVIAPSATQFGDYYTQSQSDARYTLQYPITNGQTGTTYTLVLDDVGKYVEMNNASANTLTVPPNSSVAYPVGTQVTVVQTGAGTTTITPGAGVTINYYSPTAAGTRTLKAQWAAGTLIKRATDTWVLIGNLT
jgi:hypothetical protein